MEYVMDISQKQFQDIWKCILKKYEITWKQLKNTYPIGGKIYGKVIYFYPQGSIIQGDDFKAVYKGEKNLSLHEEVCLEAVSYDNENMWIVVG